MMCGQEHIRRRSRNVVDGSSTYPNVQQIVQGYSPRETIRGGIACVEVVLGKYSFRLLHILVVLWTQAFDIKMYNLLIY
jgi:hypothetical protein